MPFYQIHLNNNQIIQIFVHILMGYFASQYSSFAKLWGLSAVAIGCFLTLKYKNRFNEAAIFAAYLVGLEILLRMTKATIFWEFGKYGTILLLLIGLSMGDLKRHRTTPLILIYLFSFLPSIILTPFDSLDFFRKNISFNLSGPLLLFTSFIYFRNRKIKINEIQNILRMLILPMIAMSTVLFIRLPELDQIRFDSEANFQMSGGYGPNQVSTGLGLVIVIIALSKAIDLTLFKKNIYDYAIIGICSIQAYLTFARGGVFTAILAIATLWVCSLSDKALKIQRMGKITLVGILLMMLWSIAEDFTSGMIEKRYMALLNVDEQGELSGSGRIEIMASDIKIFYDNYMLGVGPGMANDLRSSYGYGRIVAAHSEFTRALAEHGLFGIVALYCLIMLSINGYLVTQSDSKYLLACMTTFSLLTMLHSAMRLAIPGFIYGIGFLIIMNNKKRIKYVGKESERFISK